MTYFNGNGKAKLRIDFCNGHGSTSGVHYHYFKYNSCGQPAGEKIGDLIIDFGEEVLKILIGG